MLTLQPTAKEGLDMTFFLYLIAVLAGVASAMGWYTTTAVLAGVWLGGVLFRLFDPKDDK